MNPANPESNTPAVTTPNAVAPATPASIAPLTLDALPASPVPETLPDTDYQRILRRGLWVLAIPYFTPPLLTALVERHPPDLPIPALWKKLDPMLGSALVFFLPCFICAMLPPWMLRLCAANPRRLGTTSGLLYASGTLGSIAGVFVSGYLLIEHMTIPGIFRTVGVATILLGALAWGLDRGKRSLTPAGTFPTPPA